MTNIPDLLTMLKSGVHFGHQLSKRHPKMKPFIFMSKNGFHIIDLEQTQVKLGEALEFVKTIASNGGTVLFLGTKKQAQPIIAKAAKLCGMPYITERWLGGTLTNFTAISKVINKYRRLKDQKAKGELAKYTKKEQLEFDKEISKLEKMVGGIQDLNKIPEAIFICDVKREKTAVSEANRKNVPIVALCDTNANPTTIAYPIPANDDAIKSIELLTMLVAEAITEGKAQSPVKVAVNTEKK